MVMGPPDYVKHPDPADHDLVMRLARSLQALADVNEPIVRHGFEVSWLYIQQARAIVTNGELRHELVNAIQVVMLKS
jgi:hypothetical protein